MGATVVEGEPQGGGPSHMSPMLEFFDFGCQTDIMIQSLLDKVKTFPPAVDDVWKSFMFSMTRRMVSEENARAEHWATMLQFKEQALIEEAKAKLNLLSCQQSCGQEAGSGPLTESLHVTIQLMHQQAQMKRLVQATQVAAEDRTLLLKHLADIDTQRALTIQLQKQAEAFQKEAQRSSPQDSSQPSTTNLASRKPDYDKPCDQDQLHGLKSYVDALGVEKHEFKETIQAKSCGQPQQMALKVQEAIKVSSSAPVSDQAINVHPEVQDEKKIICPETPAECGRSIGSNVTMEMTSDHSQCLKVAMGEHCDMVEKSGVTHNNYDELSAKELYDLIKTSLNELKGTYQKAAAQQSAVLGLTQKTNPKADAESRSVDASGFPTATDAQVVKQRAQTPPLAPESDCTAPAPAVPGPNKEKFLLGMNVWLQHQIGTQRIGQQLPRFHGTVPSAEEVKTFPPATDDVWKSFMFSMTRRMVSEENARSKHWATMLQFKEQALIEEAKAKLNLLSCQQRCGQEAGSGTLSESHHVAIQLMHQQQAQMKSLVQATQAAAEDRTLLLRHLTDIDTQRALTIQLQKQAEAFQKEAQRSSSQDSSQASTTNLASRKPDYDKPCDQDQLHGSKSYVDALGLEKHEFKETKVLEANEVSPSAPELYELVMTKHNELEETYQKVSAQQSAVLGLTQKTNPKADAESRSVDASGFPTATDAQVVKQRAQTPPLAPESDCTAIAPALQSGLDLGVMKHTTSLDAKPEDIYNSLYQSDEGPPDDEVLDEAIKIHPKVQDETVIMTHPEMPNVTLKVIPDQDPCLDVAKEGNQDVVEKSARTLLSSGESVSESYPWMSRSPSGMIYYSSEDSDSEESLTGILKGKVVSTECQKSDTLSLKREEASSDPATVMPHGQEDSEVHYENDFEVLSDKMEEDSLAIACSSLSSDDSAESLLTDYDVAETPENKSQCEKETSTVLYQSYQPASDKLDSPSKLRAQENTQGTKAGQGGSEAAAATPTRQVQVEAQKTLHHPAEVEMLVHHAMQEIWQVFDLEQGPKDLSGVPCPKPSEHFLEMVHPGQAQNIGNRHSYNKLIFHLSWETLQDLCAKDPTKQPMWKNNQPGRHNYVKKLKSFNDFSKVKEYVTEEVLKLCGLMEEKDAAAYGRVFAYNYQGLNPTKFDQILMREMPEEEHKWADHDKEAFDVKNKYAKVVFDHLMDDTLKWLLGQTKKTTKKS